MTHSLSNTEQDGHFQLHDSMVGCHREDERLPGWELDASHVTWQS